MQGSRFVFVAWQQGGGAGMALPSEQLRRSRAVRVRAAPLVRLRAIDGGH